MLVKEMSREGARRVWALVFETGDPVMETLRRFADAYHEFADNRRYYGVILATARKQ